MKTMRILLVEDNEGDIVLTQDAMEESEFPLVMDVVRNGKEAINHLMKREGYEDKLKPDLIFLDINLPLKSGHEVLTEIKQNEKLKRIPVIVLTTSSSENDIKKAYQNHANCYISKAVEINQFVNTIKGIVQFWFNIVTLPSLKS